MPLLDVPEHLFAEGKVIGGTNWSQNDLYKNYKNHKMFVQ